MARRLTKGAREAIDQFDLDMVEVRDALRKAQDWVEEREPLDAARELTKLEALLRRLERRVHEDIEEILQRKADNQPTLEDRLKRQEELLRDVIERLDSLEEGRVLRMDKERSRHGHTP